MQSKISVGVVGCGAWGRNHLRIWDSLGALCAVCDSEASRLEWVEQNYPSVKRFDLVEDVLEHGGVDAIVVASSATTHFKVARAAIEAGKDVLIEKPMAMSSQDCQLLIEASKEANRVILVGHVLEYHPAVKELKNLVTSGALGRIRYIYANRLNFGRIRTEENALWSFAPHDVAVILRLLGMRPIHVSCVGAAYLTSELSDSTITTLAFPGNVHAHIFVSWLHPFKEHRLVVIGEDKMAVFNDTASWPEKLCLYSHRVHWDRGMVPVAQSAKSEFISLSEAEPLLLECMEFSRCVMDRSTPLTDGESGRRVIEVLETAQLSLSSEGHAKQISVSMQADAFVHPSAIVDPQARLGKDTKVWHFTHVMATAWVGIECTLGQNVYVGRGVSIGNRVKIQNNVSVFEGVTLEDDVFCGPSVVFTNVRRPRAWIEQKEAYENTLIKQGATLGANATIVCGVTIGRYAFVAAGAVVTKDVPNHALVRGNPAQLSGWVCECSAPLILAELDTANCDRCGRSYRHDSNGLISTGGKK